MLYGFAPESGPPICALASSMKSRALHHRRKNWDGGQAPWGDLTSPGPLQKACIHKSRLFGTHPPQAAQRRTLPDFAFGPRADMQIADRMRVAHARWFFPINGKSSAGPQRAVQVERSADECKVRESLREVSQGLATMTGLFRIEAKMVGKAEHALENQSRFLEPR